MSNPVLEALAQARLRQLSTKDAAMQAVVTQLIGEIPHHERPRPELFERFCEARATTAIPASTSAVAVFVLQHAPLGIEALVSELENIGAAHEVFLWQTLQRIQSLLPR